jgi:hypothetical protein
VLSRAERTNADLQRLVRSAPALVPLDELGESTRIELARGTAALAVRLKPQLSRAASDALQAALDQASQAIDEEPIRAALQGEPRH